MNSVVFIFITVLVDAVGFGIILPVLPELIMKLTGEGLSQASIYGGWLWFAYAVMQFFCAPVLGNLSDRFGRRPVILFSLLTFGIDYLIMGFAPTLFCLFVLPESLPQQSRRPFVLGRANPLGTLLQIRKYPSVIGLLQVLFLWQLAHQVFPSTWAYYTMLKFNWSEQAVGISLAFVGTIMAFSTAGMTRLLVPRLGEQRAALSGLLSGSAAFFGYAFASRGWMMYAFLVAWLFAGLVQPSIQGLMSRQVPANAQGELQGGVASLYSLTAVVGPPLMTQLFGYFSSGRARVHFPGAAFLCAALLAIAGLVVFVRATRADSAYSTAATASPL